MEGSFTVFRMMGLSEEKLPVHWRDLLIAIVIHSKLIKT